MSDDQEREQFVARFEAGSPEERGRIVIRMASYAAAYTVVNGGLAVSVAVSAARIWRRREHGWGAAVRTGGCWRTVAGFAAASAALSAMRKSIVDGSVGS